ncbi:hypothetical protein [Moorena bouillonii]|uniref:hypothetical protein n=1 Tax=Moorena bouillonii TaxID=207920 RepID=UPI001180F749|nr:hypothetical protein [Moorena bouillonii]
MNSFVERASWVEPASWVELASCQFHAYYRAGRMPVSRYYQAGRMPNLLLFMGRFSNALSIALVTYPVE